MKLSLAKGGSVGKTNDFVNLHFEGADNWSHIDVMTEDGDHIGRISAELDDTYTFHGVGSKRLTVKDSDGSERKMTVKKFPKRKEGDKCFAESDDKVTFSTGNDAVNAIESFELEKFDGGSYVPEFANEIRGHEDAIIAIAAGMKGGLHSMLTGPTGVGKTTMYRFLAKLLGYNLVIVPISRSTQDYHLIGEYKPAGEAGKFEWVDGEVTKAVKLSQTEPTILVFDEINRIGNIAEFARMYSLLDDTRCIELPECRDENGEVPVLKAGQLFIGATANPVDDEEGAGDYIGVQELDPALLRRFPLQPRVSYPSVEEEARLIADRVETCSASTAKQLAEIAKNVRTSTEVRFPIAFTHLEACAEMIPYCGIFQAFELAVVQHAPTMVRQDVRNIAKLKGISEPGSVNDFNTTQDADSIKDLKF